VTTARFQSGIFRALTASQRTLAFQPPDTACGESLFLLECVRHFFRPESLLAIPSNLDWTKLLALAREHSVEPLISSALHQTGTFAIPQTILDTLQQGARERAFSNLLYCAELAKILALLENAAIDVRVLKGPVLAEMLYGNIAMRSFGDLDLLVHPQDLIPTKNALEAGGYTLTSSLHWHSNSALLRARECQLSFENSRGISVDVHWQLIPDYFPKPFEENQAWADHLGVSVGGATAWTLSQENLLLFLCAHGAQHMWMRLGWICDVARLIQVAPKMDWRSVFAQASQTSTTRMLSLGLILAADLLAGEFPPEAKERIASDSRAQDLAVAIRKRYLHCAPSLALAFESERLVVHTFDRTRHRLRYRFGTLVGPSEAEYRALQLPPALFTLYYVFRPLRLSAKYLGRMLGL